MNVLDRLRVERAVQSYDFWLGMFDVPGSRRRGLRRELRANLLDAGAHDGARTAVAALGDVRRMAADVGSAEPRRPRWGRGVTIGLLVVMGTLTVEILCAFAWLDGVLATDRGAVTRGSLTLFPGSSVASLQPGDGFGIGIAFGPGWLGPALGLLTFAVVSRPWRATATARR